eukprot:g8377.t1
MTTIATSPRLSDIENTPQVLQSKEVNLNSLPEVLIICISKFLDINSLALNLFFTSKHILASLSSYDSDRNLWRNLAIILVPNVIFSAYSMSLPCGYSSWKNLVTRCYFLNKVQWIKAKAAEKAVISEKKESRSTYSFLIDVRRNVLYRVGGHYFFTVNELSTNDIELELKTGLIVTTKKWKKIRPSGVPPNPLRYSSFTCVPWQYSIYEMPCSALFRIGGADASFPYSEYIDIVIMLPFVDEKVNATNNNDDFENKKDDGSDAANKSENKKIKWRWVRPKVHGNLPPPRRSHSCTYIHGSKEHRLVMYGGGSSTDGIHNFNDLWVLDTYNDSTYVDYMTLKNQGPSKSYKASVDNISVLWTKPKISSSIPQPCSGRFSHASMYIPGMKCEEMFMKYENNGKSHSKNNNDAAKKTITSAEGVDKSFGILIFGGMAFAGSLGMYDIHALCCKDKNATEEDLLFEWKELKPTDATTFGPPNDIKGHSITYIGNKLILLGGYERTKENGVKVNSEVQDGESDTSTTKAKKDPLADNKMELHLNMEAAEKEGGKQSEEGLQSSATLVPSIRMYVLDVVQQKWYKPRNIGDYTPSNRSGHGAELWGGQIVLTGGYDTSDKGSIDRTSRLVKTDAERLVVT